MAYAPEGRSMCEGLLLAAWELITTEGDNIVFHVRRCCCKCGVRWAEHERLSEGHPGGVDAAMRERDSAAAAFHKWKH